MLRMIINLDRSKDRWQHMLGQMSDLGMDDATFSEFLQLTVES